MSALVHIAAVGVLLVTASRRRWPPRRRAIGYGVAAALFAGGALAGGWLVATKWLGQLVMPPGLLWLALLGAATWLVAKRRRGRWAALTLLAGYWLVASSFFGAWLLRWLEAPYVDPAPATERFAAVVVLGGGTSTRPSGMAQLAPSGDRVATAARLYHRGRTARIVCTGTALAPRGRGRGRSLAAQAERVLVDLAVPPEAVTRLDGPRNTREELAAVGELLRQRGWKRVGLITSAWHMRRAMKHARRQGLELTPIGADFRSVPHRSPALALLPHASALLQTEMAMWEILGAAVGR